MRNLTGKDYTHNSVFTVMVKGYLVPPPYLDEHVVTPPYRDDLLITSPCREDRLITPSYREESLITPSYREDRLLVLLIIGDNDGLKDFDFSYRGLVVLLRD